MYLLPFFVQSLKAMYTGIWNVFVNIYETVMDSVIFCFKFSSGAFFVAYARSQIDHDALYLEMTIDH